jgi:hypothetical protein
LGRGESRREHLGAGVQRSAATIDGSARGAGPWTNSTFTASHSIRTSTDAAERDLSEIPGIVKGTLADGIVVDTEIAVLHQWAETHPDALAHWSVPRDRHRQPPLGATSRQAMNGCGDLARIFLKICHLNVH